MYDAHPSRNDSYINSVFASLPYIMWMQDGHNEHSAQNQVSNYY